MEWNLRIIAHDVDLFLADDVAAEVLLELDATLQGHAQISGFVVTLEEFFRRVNLIHVLPAAAVIGLKERREADVLENLFPIQRIDQVSNGLLVRVRRMLVVRQDYSWRNGDAQLGGERVVEKLVVGGPPEG